MATLSNMLVGRYIGDVSAHPRTPGPPTGIVQTVAVVGYAAAGAAGGSGGAGQGQCLGRRPRCLPNKKGPANHGVPMTARGHTFRGRVLH